MPDGDQPHGRCLLTCTDAILGTYKSRYFGPEGDRGRAVRNERKVNHFYGLLGLAALTCFKKLAKAATRPS